MSHVQSRRRRFLIQLISALSIASLLFAGCAAGQPEGQDTGKSLLFWHEWKGEDAVVLAELLEKYTAFNANNVDYLLTVWVKDAADMGKVTSDLRLMLLTAFGTADIPLA